MKKVLRVHHVNAFTQVPFQGSQVCVVTHGDGLSTRQLKAVARELDADEVAFVLPPQGSGHDVRLSVIRREQDTVSFGAAVIAANTVLAAESPRPMVRMRQLLGADVFDVEHRQGVDGVHRVWVQQPGPRFGPPLSECERSRLLGALGLRMGDLGSSPIDMASGEQVVVLLPMRDADALGRIVPHAPSLRELGEGIDCDAFLAFVPVESGAADMSVQARMFVPRSRLQCETPAAGACGFVAAYLLRHCSVLFDLERTATRRFVFTHGNPDGRRWQVAVEADMGPAPLRAPALRFGGSAAIVMATDLRIDALGH